MMTSTALPERTPRSRLALLAAMLFLQHAIFGCWVPVLQLHLQTLGFSGGQIGWIYAAPAISSIFAPWIAGQLADRVFSAPLVMAGSHLLSGICLWLASGQSEFAPTLVFISIHALLYMPTLGLSNLIVFRNLADREHEFGLVRLWGTASWIVMAAVIGFWLSRPAWLPGAANANPSDGLRLAAVLSFVLTAFCFLLPSTPPVRGGSNQSLAIGAALQLLRDRSFAIFMAITFVLAAMMPFVYPYGGLFLRSLGVSDAKLAPLMAIGQCSEVAMFFLFSIALRRLGLKRMFLIGTAAWMVRFVIWSFGFPWPLVVASLGLHGFCYAFVIGLGQVLVDRLAPPDARASAQAFHQVVAFGVAAWLGTILAGSMHDALTHTTPDGTVEVAYGIFFAIPAVAVAVCFVVFALFFKPPKPSAARPDPVPDLPM